MEKISIIISIIAIAVSIISMITMNKRQYRINNINLESVYFKEIYMHHLIHNIPNNRNLIKFDCNDKLIGTDELIDELQLLLQDSLYFYYTNEKFYDSLEKCVQKLENYLVENSDRVFTGEKQTKGYNTIRDDISSIYKVISENYLS